MERYGVPPQLIGDALAHNNKVLAVGAATMIQQVCSLHISFHDLRDDPRFARFFAVETRFLTIWKSITGGFCGGRRAVHRRRYLDLAVHQHGRSRFGAGGLRFIAQECEDLREKVPPLAGGSDNIGSFQPRRPNRAGCGFRVSNRASHALAAGTAGGDICRRLPVLRGADLFHDQHAGGIQAAIRRESKDCDAGGAGAWLRADAVGLPRRIPQGSDQLRTALAVRAALALPMYFSGWYPTWWEPRCCL